MDDSGEKGVKGLSIIHSTNVKLNPTLLVSLLPSFFLRDFELHEDGILCILKSDANTLEPILENFLSNLNKLTGCQFYFEFLSDKMLLLKIYNREGLQFHESLLHPFRSNSQFKEL